MQLNIKRGFWEPMITSHVVTQRRPFSKVVVFSMGDVPIVAAYVIRGN